MSINSKHIKWELVLSIDKHVFNAIKDKSKLLLSALYSTFFCNPGIDKNIKSRVDFLFFKSMVRADYKKLFEMILSQCDSSKAIVDFDPVKTYFPRVYPIYILIKYFKCIFYIRNIASSKYEFLYLAIRLLSYLEVYEKIRINIDFNNLVVFADMQQLDNLLVQVSKLKGKKTVTLQHGLYIDYTDYPNINSINYTNSVADYFLAWGKETSNLIKSYHTDKCIYICGKPLSNIVLNNITSTNYISVLFDQNLLRSYNSDMLRLAYKFSDETGLKVNVRLHPRNNPKSYKLRPTTLINKDVESSIIILAHTTSMIHELMRLGIPVFKYKSDIPALNVPDRFIFTSHEDLLDKYKSDEISADYFKDFAKEHILFIGNESLLKYRDFFNMLKQSENLHNL